MRRTPLNEWWAGRRSCYPHITRTKFTWPRTRRNDQRL